jgi:hypothetical protein
MLNRWITYKARFKAMYGVSIVEHYKKDKESLEILKYEILFM